MKNKNIYKKLLNNTYFHSVRDERSKEYVESLGLKAINTGCVTMWMLTPEFCKTIPTKKASRVVFTLTAREHNHPMKMQDQELINILNRNYEDYLNYEGDDDNE